LSSALAIALLTTNMPGYRVPLFRLLAREHGVEVLCHGGGERYVAPWFNDLNHQLASAPFPAHRIGGVREAFELGGRYDAVIAPFAGGPLLPAAYAGARRYGAPFLLWASVWAQPRSVSHAAALPLTRHIFRHADAVIAYGEHVRRFVGSIRGRDDDVFVAPQSVEPELFAREVSAEEVSAFRARHKLGAGPLVLYSGRVVAEKGALVLQQAWRRVRSGATLVIVGDGPLVSGFASLERTCFLGPIARDQLPVANAAAELAVLPSIPTPRFREPWGLVCNEAMHQARPMIASAAVGAVAGGLVRHADTGWVVAPGDADALGAAIDQLLGHDELRRRLGERAKAAVASHTYEAMEQAFARALVVATANRVH
jgi:glycosyltransferase involved in cell wall biosynthesis